jgi:hypothetical protein
VIEFENFVYSVSKTTISMNVKTYNSINEILADVDKGIEVYWSNLNYKIIKKSFEYYIKSNSSMISFLDGNGEPNVNLLEVFSKEN